MRRVLSVSVCIFILLSACAVKSAGPPPFIPDRSRPLPASDEFLTVAEYGGLTLQYKHDTCEIRVLGGDGGAWRSTPEDAENDPLAKGQYKMALSSLLQATFLSQQGNEDTETAMAGSVRRGAYEAFQIPNGVLIELYFPAKLTTVPVELTLDDGSLLCSVRPGQITVRQPQTEDEAEAASRGYKITGVSLLPYFLSAGPACEGYMLVPDGCGALINLNNGKTSAAYAQNVYGSDAVLPPALNRGGVMDALLPVLGLYRDGNGVLCVLEDGAALAQINAAVGGGRTSYNTVYPAFSLRQTGLYSVTKVDGTIQDIKVAADDCVGVERVSARYYFLGEGGDYSAMARAYREYLERKGFSRTEEVSAYAALDVYASVIREQSVLGVPARIRSELTSPARLSEMVRELTEAGVSSPVVRYTNWDYGGRKGLRDAAAALERLGASLWLEQEFLLAGSKPFLGIGKPVIRDISNMPVAQYDYDLALYDPSETLRSKYYLYAHGTVLSSAQKAAKPPADGIDGYGVGSMGNMLYSDAGKKQVDRQTAAGLFAEAAGAVRGKTGRLITSGACDYLLPLSDVVINAPDRCSGFIIEDAEIPFYAMVTRGRAPLSLSSWNLSADPELCVLKAAESAAMLTFTAVSDPAPVKDTPLEWLYGASYDFWKEPFIQAVSRLAPLYDAVGNSAMTRHETLAPGVTRTVFENGVSVTVNFTYEDCETAPARDFTVSQGGA